MKRSLQKRSRAWLVCMVVLFAISLQCATLSSFLSALHEVEHVAELAGAHSSPHHDHHHPHGGDHHHGEVHHHPAPDADAATWLVFDGHSHGLDPDHLSGEHGLLHFSGGAVLYDDGGEPPNFGQPLPAEPPPAFRLSSLPLPAPGALLRPPIA